jgi:hypothetical protein
MARLVLLCSPKRPCPAADCTALPFPCQTLSTNKQSQLRAIGIGIYAIRVASREYRTSSMLVRECGNCARSVKAAQTECGTCAIRHSSADVSAFTGNNS